MFHVNWQGSNSQHLYLIFPQKQTIKRVMKVTNDNSTSFRMVRELIATISQTKQIRNPQVRKPPRVFVARVCPDETSSLSWKGIHGASPQTPDFAAGVAWHRPSETRRLPHGRGQSERLSECHVLSGVWKQKTRNKDRNATKPGSKGGGEVFHVSFPILQLYAS